MKLEDYLKAVEERSEAATKGPWEKRGEYLGFNRVIAVDEHSIPTNTEEVCISPARYHPFVADFIAHARTDVPLLVKALRKAMADLFMIQSVEVWGDRQGWQLMAKQALAEIEEMVGDKEG